MPTRGTAGVGVASNLEAGYEQYSNVRSSQKSGGAYNSGLYNYASTGANSGMSRRGVGYTTH
jgi:hypothetical protein